MLYKPSIFWWTQSVRVHVSLTRMPQTNRCTHPFVTFFLGTDLTWSIYSLNFNLKCKLKKGLVLSGRPLQTVSRATHSPAATSSLELSSHHHAISSTPSRFTVILQVHVGQRSTLIAVGLARGFVIFSVTPDKCWDIDHHACSSSFSFEIILPTQIKRVV
jgi:hypothetical protein